MAEVTTFKNCEVKVDHERGVIYINSSIGYPLIRLSQCPSPIPHIREGRPYQLDYTIQQPVTTHRRDSMG